MKKFMFVLMAVFLTGALVSCGQTKKDANGTVYNEKYDEEKMKNVKGDKVTIKDNDEVTLCKTSGFAFVKPKGWESVENQDGIDEYPQDPEAYSVMYMPKEQVEKMHSIDKDTMSEDEIRKIKKEAYASEFYAFAIYRINDDDEETAEDAKMLEEDFSKVDKIGTVDKDTFYIAYNDEVPTEGFTDSEKDDIKKILDTINEVKDSIMIFPPTDPMDDFKASMEQFTTTDLEGNEVTQDILKDYDVTMVNVWATWCKYCVSEMPEIEKLYEELPDNTNIITICTDGDTKTDAAKELLNKTRAKFTTLKLSDELQENVIEYVKGYPTTFFVDKDGKVIGKLQIGTPASEGEITQAYKDLIEDALSSQGE